MSREKQKESIILLPIVADRLLDVVNAGFELTMRRPDETGKGSIAVDAWAYSELKRRLKILLPDKSHEQKK